MQDDLTIKLELPADNDGFVELQCRRCGSRFGLRPEDVEADDVLDVRCPACGLTADSFAPDEAIEAARAMALNQIQGMIHGELKKLERRTRGKPVQIKAGRKPADEYEASLCAGYDGFLVVRCGDCGREVKVSPLLAMSSCVCPCCGKGQFDMTDGKIELKTTLYEFSNEASALMRADYNGLKPAVERFLLYIEGDSFIRPFIDDCVENHVPADFDAVTEVSEVNGGQALFGPFPPHFMAEAGEVYLILKELLRSNSFRSYGFLLRYGGGSKKFNDMTEGFLDKVARRLVNGIERYLSVEGIKMGLGSQVQLTNNFNNDGPASSVIAQGNAVVNIDQSSGFDAAELEALLKGVLDVCGDLPSESAEQASELVEGIKQEMGLEKPKKGVVGALLSGLKGLNGGVQFAAAVASLAEFVMPLFG